MKKIFLLLAFFIGAISIYAQSPDAFNYQAVARNASGVALINQNIAVRITIHDATSGGSILYSERQTATTNQFGLFTCQVGTGTLLSGNFSTINWAGDLKFLQVEFDPTGGTSYIDMGTTQMISVPFAKNANTLNMFASGTANPDKMIITHSPAWQNYGLQYHDATDVFNFVGAGIPVLSIGLGSGNVGVGINNPNYLFHVNALNGSQTAFAQFTNVASGTGSTNGVRIGLNNIGEGVFSIDGNHPLRFISNNSEIVHIDGAGTVGIGTITPVAKVQIVEPTNSALKVGPTSGGTLSYTTINMPPTTSGLAGIFRVRHNGSTQLVVDTAGATYRLTIYGSALASGGTWTNSDRRIKREIKPLDNALASLMQLKPTSYYFDRENSNYKYLGLPSELQFGLLAQDVKEIFPNVVRESTMYDEDGKPRAETIHSMNYTELIPVLVKAIQEQQAEIEALKIQVKNQQK